MGYNIRYLKSNRNWTQKTIGDYVLGADEQHEAFLDRWQDALWKKKKEIYYRLKDQGIKPKKQLRRGARLCPYPRYRVYHMDVPCEVSDVKRFPWFTRNWKQNRRKRPSSHHSAQKTLDNLIPNLYLKRYHGKSRNYASYYFPKFRSTKISTKDDFCSEMSDWAWAACHSTSKKIGFTPHIFYLNNFDTIDEATFNSDSSTLYNAKCLPSDLIKMELFRLLSGFSTFQDFFRMWDMVPYFTEELAINMPSGLPSNHRYSSSLKSIGVAPIQNFFDNLVAEARKLGLIRDIIHIWDGQFHESWLKKSAPRKPNYPPFYGGLYNHGGKKVGVGVVESTIMDWNGMCTIPVHTKVFPANENENPIVRKTIKEAYMFNKPHPRYFLADRGPSGRGTQQSISDFGICPIIPLRSNVKKGVKVTSGDGLRYFDDVVPNINPDIYDRLYRVRTRIEEHYGLNDTVFRLGKLHVAGKEFTQIEILLENCLGVLIPLTAYKIGRPDLMWSPSSFRHTGMSPELLFPEPYRVLESIRGETPRIPRNFNYRGIGKLNFR